MCWSCDCCWNVELWIGIKNMHSCLYPFPEPTNFQDATMKPTLCRTIESYYDSANTPVSPWRPCRWKQAGRRWRWSPARNVRPSPTQSDPTQPSPTKGSKVYYYCNYLEKLLVLDQWLHLHRHFTLVQKSKSYQVDKSQSTALASSHPFSHTNNKWVPFEWAGHFWRYHLTRFEALCMQLEHTKHMAHYWKQQWRKASRQQLYSNWIVTLPQVSHSVLVAWYPPS